MTNIITTDTGFESNPIVYNYIFAFLHIQVWFTSFDQTIHFVPDALATIRGISWIHSAYPIHVPFSNLQICFPWICCSYAKYMHMVQVGIVAFSKMGYRVSREKICKLSKSQRFMPHHRILQKLKVFLKHPEFRVNLYYILQTRFSFLLITCRQIKIIKC